MRKQLLKEVNDGRRKMGLNPIKEAEWDVDPMDSSNFELEDIVGDSPLQNCPNCDSPNVEPLDNNKIECLDCGGFSWSSEGTPSTRYYKDVDGPMGKPSPKEKTITDKRPMGFGAGSGDHADEESEPYGGAFRGNGSDFDIRRGM